MARIFRIPDQYADGIVSIRKQPEDVMLEFSAALSTVAPSLSRDTIVSTVSSSVTSIPQNEVQGMVAAVVSLYAALDSSDVSIEPFVEQICKAMAESKRKDLNFDGDADRDRFRDRLTKLLKIDSLGIASKALSLKTECDHLFCSGRILTDARPVYGADVSTAPRAALVLHTLRLAYHEANDLREFYITFDDSDLKELRDLVGRAELKSKSLTATLKAAGIGVITTE
jgi:hypothetical protein